MTARARVVLEDCHVVLDLLEEEKDLRRWRIHWVAALALLRAVGHVLEKIDGSNPRVAALSRAAYKMWKGNAPEHEIFREFIEKERNSILKEYEFRTHPNETIEFVLVRTLQRVSDGALIQDAQVAEIGDNIYRPLMDGFRDGDDARDVYSEALEWWDGELEAIENALSGTGGSSAT